MNKIKPVIARNVIYLQQYDFDVIHKDSDTIKHVHAYRDIYITDREEIEPVINTIQEKQ